jgi:hypothetical protein
MGTVILLLLTGNWWKVIVGNEACVLEASHQRRYISVMPEVWNTSAPPVRGAATPTGPGSWRQLGECSSTGLYQRHENRLGYVEVGVEGRIDAGVILIT